MVRIASNAESADTARISGPERVALGRLLLVFWALMVAPQLSLAGQWDIVPRFSLDETYTDNVRLVDEGERGDFITSIRPGLAMRGESARLRANIDYNLERLEYGHETSYNDTNHQLQGDVDATLIKNWLFFDANSRIAQEAQGRQQLSRNTRGPGNNQRDLVLYELSPRLQHGFGSWVELIANYRYQDVDRNSRGDQVNNNDTGSTEDSYLVQLNSGRRFARTPARFTFETRDLDRGDSRPKSEFTRYIGELSYVFDRRLRFTATGGTESNKFPTSQNQLDGPFWTIGGTWTPSERTELSGSWGDRFYGNTFSVSGRHRLRRWSLFGEYSENLQTANQFERGLQLVPLLDGFGEPVFDPVTNNQFYTVLEAPDQTEDVYVVKQATAGLSYRLRRGNLNLRLFQYDRQYQGGDYDDKRQGASLNFDWNLSRQLRYSIGATWQGNKRSDQAGTAKFYSIYPSLSYRLGPHSTARLRYEFTKNDDPQNIGGAGGLTGKYVENALSGAIIFTL